jgi:hypothetical protein
LQKALKKAFIEKDFGTNRNCRKRDVDHSMTLIRQFDSNFTLKKFFYCLVDEKNANDNCQEDANAPENSFNFRYFLPADILQVYDVQEIFSE